MFLYEYAKISFSRQMLLSDFLKLFLAAFLLICTSCNSWQTAENSNSAPLVTEESKTGIPFQNKEPDTFQTEIVITNFLNGEKIEKKYFTARRGAQRLTIFNYGESNETSILHTADGRVFFVQREKKTFEEKKSGTEQLNTEFNDFLTTEWLNQKQDAAFEDLGTENNLTKYRVRLNNSETSEILIYVDENLKLPVKQEFYIVEGEQRTLTLSVEMKNFAASADENLFALPQDYKESAK